VTDDARRHHYVPACYLRHFAMPNDRLAGRLYAYDRTRGKQFASTPDKSAHARDFYRVEIDGVHPNLIENTYESIETRFAPTLAGVVERGTLPTDPIARQEMFAFVASQATRTPRVREQQARWFNDVAMLMMRTLADNKPAFMKQLRATESDATDESAEELWATHVAFVNAKGARVEIDQAMHARDSLDAAADLEAVLARRYWILGVAADNAAFVTSDDPVQVRPTGLGQPRHPLWSPGFADPDTEVLIPLSPRLVMIGLPNEFTARARIRFSRTEVAEINTNTVFASHRFVYSTVPTFAHVDVDGAVVDGPTEFLRKLHTPSRPTGFFSAATRTSR
jgi:Protein of unknown function (DUF4238)